MRKFMEENMYYTGAVLGIIGLAFLSILDWRIAIGVFLMTWGNNVQMSASKRRIT